MNQLSHISHSLTENQFKNLLDVPAEAEWFANISSAQTRRAYQSDISAFMRYVGVSSPQNLREVSRGHILAWRSELEKQGLAGSSIRRKLAALSSLFDYLCNANSVLHNPVRGVRRPRVESTEGKTPALSNAQAQALLEAPSAHTLKGLRDRAILSVLLHHGLRREELVLLRVRDFAVQRRGIAHMVVHGKGAKLRYVELHPETQARVRAYLAVAGHGGLSEAALFQSLSGPLNAQGTRAMRAGAVYAQVVRHYLHAMGIDGQNLGPHVLRATAATNALENGADLSATMRWLGHAHIGTTKIYDRRGEAPGSVSPTTVVQYGGSSRGAVR